jgi:hypothetical protein
MQIFFLMKALAALMVSTTSVQYGMCVPSSCSEDDMYFNNKVSTLPHIDTTSSKKLPCSIKKLLFFYIQAMVKLFENSDNKMVGKTENSFSMLASI